MTGTWRATAPIPYCAVVVRLQVLSLYLMLEKLKGDASFWAPYLRILPTPGSISDWSVEQLNELQNDAMAAEALGRAPRFEASYRRLFEPLFAAFPVRGPLARCFTKTARSAADFVYHCMYVCICVCVRARMCSRAMQSMFSTETYTLELFSWAFKTVAGGAAALSCETLLPHHELNLDCRY